MLSLEFVLNNPLVRLTDSNEKLKVYSYNECNESSEELLQKCRGAIFNEEKLLFTSFPYTIEITGNESSVVNHYIGSIFDKCKFYRAYEGCLIRVFFHEDKWYVATTRKLDAFKSKWAAKETFGTLFVEALKREIDSQGIETDAPLEYLFTQLQSDKQYMFLLQNNLENRIVCEYEIPKVYHVGTFIGQDLVTLDKPLFIPFHEELSFDTIEHLVNFCNDKINYKLLQGVVVFGPDNKQYKIYNPSYARRLAIRNNEPSIKFRYLQVRLNKEDTLLIKEMYPEFIKDFEEYEALVQQAAKSIHNSYVKRYIKGEFVSVPQEEFAVMRDAHDWHKKNMRYNRVTYDVILVFLNKGTPTNLNRIIKHIKFGTTEKAQKVQEARRLLRTENEVKNEATEKST